MITRRFVPCICVFMLGHDQLRVGRFHSIFRVIEIHGYEELSDQLELHIVALPRFPRKGSPEREQDRALAAWAEFFMARTDKEQEEACHE